MTSMNPSSTLSIASSMNPPTTQLTSNVGETANITTTSVTHSPFNDNFLFCFHGSNDFIYEFKIFLYFVNPAFALLGYITNILCMVILRKSGLHKPANILLFALVLADSMNLLTNVNYADMLRYFGPDKTKAGYCTWEYDNSLNLFLYVSFRALYLIGEWGHTVNASIPIIITIERLLAVYFPVTFKKLVNKKSVFISCFFAYIFWLPWIIFETQISRLAYVEISKGKYVALSAATDIYKRNFNTLYIFVAYVLETLASWFPIAFICLGCLLIAIKVRLALQQRKKMSAMTNKNKWSTRTTRTLLTSCLVFAVSHAVNTLISQTAPVNFDVPGLTSFLVFFSQFINILNCSCNFLVYMLCDRCLYEIFLKIIKRKIDKKAT